VLLDKSNVTAQYSSATFLANAEVSLKIDSQHAIAHNKVMITDDATVITGGSLACPPLPPNHQRPGSLAPNLGDHGPSDSALAAASGWRLRRPAADRHAARCASRDLCSGARHSAPGALAGSFNFTKAAEHANAENLVILKDAPELAQRYRQNWLAHAAHSSAYQAKDAALRKGPVTEQELHSQGTRASNITKETDNSIHGNRRSKVYHLPTCPGYNKLASQNIVSFSSEADARRAGYRKAENCP
jgi:phosphatidylserine/phosphatidylglycerophosphate/cardiolipin synthase-like enzyme